MPEITVNVPSVGTHAYFTFKEPVNYYLRNKYNLNSLGIKLKVVSIISMNDIIRNDMRDPYSDIYVPANISEAQYKKDLLDDISIVSLSYTDIRGVLRFIRCPINYIESISSVTNREYLNKVILIDLNKLDSETDLTPIFNDLKDFIESRTGIEPQVKEVSIGEIEFVTEDEHVLRETIRNNSKTVYKTLSVQLEEITLNRDQILQRLSDLNIALG